MNKHEKINKLIAKGLNIVGTPMEDSSFGTKQFKLQTLGGELVVTFATTDRNYRSRYAVISVYSMFTDIELAKERISRDRLNAFSGKWNWCHYAAEKTAEGYALNVLSDIMMILPDNDLKHSFFDYLEKLSAKIDKKG